MIFNDLVFEQNISFFIKSSSTSTEITLNKLDCHFPAVYGNDLV